MAFLQRETETQAELQQLVESFFYIKKFTAFEGGAKIAAQHEILVFGGS